MRVVAGWLSGQVGWFKLRWTCPWAGALCRSGGGAGPMLCKLVPAALGPLQTIVWLSRVEHPVTDECARTSQEPSAGSSSLWRNAPLEVSVLKNLQLEVSVLRNLQLEVSVLRNLQLEARVTFSCTGWPIPVISMACDSPPAPLTTPRAVTCSTNLACQSRA